MILRAVTATLIGIMFLISVIVASVAGTFLADRTPPLVVISIKMVKPVVAPGETQFIEYKLYRERTCRVHSDRLLYDSEHKREELPDFDAVLQVTDRPELIMVPIKVPTYFAPGTVTYRASGWYECNIIHRIWPIPAQPVELTFEVQPT